MSDAIGEREVSNFGANVCFRPTDYCEPQSEAELLAYLSRHPGRRIRAIGSLHSWSQAPLCEDLLVSLKHFNSVKVIATGEPPTAEIGAGCQIKRVLKELASQGGFTLPSLGLITEQTIAGATATATHGSGRYCLSHYIQAVRIVMWDVATQTPVIREITDGEELQAAKCSLGCMGIITSVRISIRPQYAVEEHICRYDRIDQVLAAEEQFPLQQTFLIPWRWDFFAQHRREVNSPRSFLAPVYRIYWSVGMDIVFHLIIRVLARWLPQFCSRFYYRWLLPLLVPQNWKVVDRSDRQLTMEHELFRHIEIEVFVRRSDIEAAIELTIWLLKHCAGESASLSEHLRQRLDSTGDWSTLAEYQGCYFHHYAICIRKILPDDLLISMSSGGDEAYYAISFISYALPHRRAGFYRFAEVLARTMAHLFNARPHWGKYCPLPPEELSRLYPHLATFARHCRTQHSTEVFANNWTKTILEVASVENV